jgi:hypothetical protein
MDAIQKYARDLDPGIGQCLLTQSAAAAPSRILPPHPQVWIHVAQPLGLSPKRQTTARPLMRAKLLLRSTTCIVQTNAPSAAPRLGMLRSLYRLLAPAALIPSPCYLLPPHACSRHKLLAPGPPSCSQCPSRPLPAKKREKSVHYSPSMPCGFRWYLRKAKLCL